MDRQRFYKGVWFLFVLMLIGMLCLAGCSAKKQETSYNNRGMDDGVDGFLFNFDQRSEVTALVDFYKKKQFPVSVTWSYDKSAPENQRKQQSFKSVTSDDPDRVREIYFALSNTIIMGVASDQKDEVRYYVSFTLPDDTICRFDFVAENTIRIGNQNYVAESDGYLWRYLTAPEEAGTESALEEMIGEAGTERVLAEVTGEAGTENVLVEMIEEAGTEYVLAEMIEEIPTESTTEDTLVETEKLSE